MVGFAGGLDVTVLIARPYDADGVPCDESRLVRPTPLEAVPTGAGVTKAESNASVAALSPTSRIAAASQGASASRIAKEHAISRSASEAGTTKVRPAPYTP